VVTTQKKNNRGKPIGKPVLNGYQFTFNMAMNSSITNVNNYQEQQSSLGVRRLVPQPVPAVRAVPGQRRGLRDAQLHSHAGDDDPV